MDLRIQTQNIDRELKHTKHQNQLLLLNCQVLGTLAAKHREGIAAAVEQLTNANPIPSPELVDAINTLNAMLKLEPNEIANTVIQQGMALRQLRALVAQQQTRLDQLEAAEAEKAKAEDDPK